MTTPFEAAVAAHRAGDFAAAERAYLQLSTSVNANHNLAVLYTDFGHPERAEAIFRHLVEQRPADLRARQHLALLRLAQRRYDEAWLEHEAVRLAVNPEHVAPVADNPAWTGGPLAGRRLTVVAEQGAGDQIMWGRYLAALGERGAAVTVASGPALTRLFEAVGVATCPLPPAGAALPAADLWVMMGSLPAILGGPPPGPEWLAGLAGTGGGGVGVMPRGNPAYVHDASRSPPDAMVARLLRLGRDLRPEASGAKDFRDTAAIVAGLDLVISVDTSVAHLAASMGKPVWVLLPRLSLDWRWNDGVRSDWYPQARLLRQDRGRDWAGLIDRVERDLAET